ncbi:MAG TPA: beta-L-arabinofuranosidase domain-containing protein, partial [Lacipirellulaceae bacterium]
DVMELALYNAVLSGISLEGTDYFYVNPMRHIESLPSKLRWPRRRVSFVNSFCCPPNILRTIAEVNGYAYSKAANEVWINLYGSSVLSTELNGEPLKMTQETNYPWDGRVHITINKCPSHKFILKLRTPGWAESAALYLNGERSDVRTSPASYAEIRRGWTAGDVVRLELAMPPKLIEAHPLVEETRNQVAVKRGPIVYCLESCDLPDGVRVQDIHVPADSRLTARYDGGLLSGVTVIEGKAFAKRTASWKGSLYRPLQADDAREIKVRLIPYYAWANRQPSEMSVWLPLK